MTNYVILHTSEIVKMYCLIMTKIESQCDISHFLASAIPHGLPTAIIVLFEDYFTAITFACILSAKQI